MKDDPFDYPRIWFNEEHGTGEPELDVDANEFDVDANELEQPDYNNEWDE